VKILFVSSVILIPKFREKDLFVSALKELDPSFLGTTDWLQKDCNERRG
jgi:hypothetical protein